ncbi:MAG: signal peptidase I [Clostridia bacterium]|nr:signal peptidase I [Clostridia bacterium]
MNTEEVNIPKQERKLSEKIFSIATSVLLAIAILFCGTVMYQIKTNGYVTIFGCSVFRVVSESMGDTMPVGSLIISQKTDIESIKEGDIISFFSRESYMAGQIITHRVAEIKDRDGELLLVTRGDANNSVDGFYVTKENFIGKIIVILRPEGFITTLYSILTNKIGFFSVVVVPVIILVTIIMQENIKKITKEIKAIKQEINEAEREQDEEKLREELRQKLKQEILAEIEAENGKQQSNEDSPNEADSREAEK